MLARRAGPRDDASMPRRSGPLPRITPLVLAVPFAACSAVQDDLSRQLLVPPPAWLAEPADFGLRAERFEVEIHSAASLTGWWIPHENGEQRTVVLLHDADTNASAAHPWYRFLHDAGFQVLVFDPRGYGRSKGTPTLLAWQQDLPELLDWLRERPDVDPARIAAYGTGLGSVAALWAARTQGLQALVLEHLPSLRDMLREAQGDDGSAFAAVRLGLTEFAGLPEELEPDDNAPRTNVPALFVATDGELVRDRKALVRTFGSYAGDKQLWVLQDTGRAPHGMLTHDGEYQARIAAFLRRALAGEPAVVTAATRKVDTARDGHDWWQVDVEMPPGAAAAGAAVEACAVLADGSVHFARAWLGESRLRLKLPSPPVAAGAVVVPDAVRDQQTVFRRQGTERMRAAAAVDACWPRIQALRNDALPPAEHDGLRADLAAAAAAAPFPADLDAELADVHAKLGQSLAASGDPHQRALGQQLLQRAVAAAPVRPELHVWLGPNATFGYPQQQTIDAAKRLLAAPPK